MKNQTVIRFGCRHLHLIVTKLTPFFFFLQINVQSMWPVRLNNELHLISFALLLCKLMSSSVQVKMKNNCFCVLRQKNSQICWKILKGCNVILVHFTACIEKKVTWQIKLVCAYMCVPCPNAQRGFNKKYPPFLLLLKGGNKLIQDVTGRVLWPRRFSVLSFQSRFPFRSLMSL